MVGLENKDLKKTLPAAVFALITAAETVVAVAVVVAAAASEFVF